MDQKAQLMDALFDGLKSQIKNHLEHYINMKMSDQEHVMAEHHKTGLHIVLDVYETAHDVLEELLATYR